MPRKKGSCTVSKRRYTPVLAFFLSNLFFYFTLKILLPAIMPLAVKLCCLTHYSFVFILTGSQKSYWYIAQFGILWIKPPWLWCLQGKFKHIFLLLSIFFWRFIMLYFVTASNKKVPDFSLRIPKELYLDSWLNKTEV